MKLKSTFTVVLESPDENAEFVFKTPRINKLLELQSDTDDPKRNFRMLTDYLVSVKGLYNDDGSEVSVTQIIDLDLDLATTQAIIEGYWGRVNQKTKQDLEKKVS